MSVQRKKAEFIEPMLLLASESLPEGPGWIYELKAKRASAEPVSRFAFACSSSAA
jgi:hypothetical protein